MDNFNLLNEQNNVTKAKKSKIPNNNKMNNNMNLC